MEPLGFLMSPPQQGLIGSGLPSPLGSLWAEWPIALLLQARPLSCSGTGDRAGKAKLPNRQIKHVFRALAVKGHQQSV